ncbi:hypothetical protein O6H91_02G139400 [Diphasiastrum complanatum]|uniref:Uncharacterized protein n=1 Tax=Diphasiastrum complanatum TaxID=34168 RepID=A0ACC2ELI6_DIPCM|nr:hypothetical protein O6H91_02G139400 [Diphasiastrum complanatum]
MGACMSCAASSNGSEKTIKVMQIDGTVREFPSPVVVAELMLDHPQHYVCHCNSSHKLRVPAALPADVQLEVGQVYYLIPCLSLKSGADSLFKLKNSSSAQIMNAKAKRSFRSLGGILELLKIKQKTSISPMVLSTESTSKSFSKETHEAPRVTEGGIWDADLEEEISNRLRMMSRSRSWRPKLQTIEEMGFPIRGDRSC